MPFWLGIQKNGRGRKNEENGEKKRKMGKKMKYFAFWLGIKKKGARKKESEKKGKRERKKKTGGTCMAGRGGAYYAFLFKIYIKSGEKEKRGKR